MTSRNVWHCNKAFWYFHVWGPRLLNVWIPLRRWDKLKYLSLHWEERGTATTAIKSEENDKTTNSHTFSLTASRSVRLTHTGRITGCDEGSGPQINQNALSFGSSKSWMAKTKRSITAAATIGSFSLITAGLKQPPSAHHRLENDTQPLTRTLIYTQTSKGFNRARLYTVYLCVWCACVQEKRPIW